MKLTEQEKYFAAKNRRRQWWRENWGLLIFVPAMIAGCICGFIMLCAVIYAIGRSMLGPL